MRILLIIFFLLNSFQYSYSTAVFSIKVNKQDKLANDSLFFQLVDQQRIIQNDGIVKLDIFHAPSGFQYQKIAWIQDGICNQFISFNGIKNGKLFIRATTTLGGIENSKSEFLIFIEQAKIVSIQELYCNKLDALKLEAESGEILEGFSNKIAIISLNTHTGKLQKEQVSITTADGDTISRFTVGGKRLIELYLEQGRQYYLHSKTTTKTIELNSTLYGYGIKCKQIGDSLDIEVQRGKLQPLEQLHFCIQVNNKLDTIASFVFDDSLFVMSTRFIWPPTNNLYISFLLMNNSNQLLVKRYWVPDSELLNLSPFYTKLNSRSLTIDSEFTMQFACKGCDREQITYKVMDKDNTLLDVGKVQWLSDSLFAINNLQLVGMGHLLFSVDRSNMYWKPIIQSITFPIIKPSLIFYAKEDVFNSTDADNYIEKDNTTKNANNNLLPDVIVTGARKTRLEELEEKYVTNIMFKSLFSVNINVLDDENSKNGITLFEYVQQKIPFLTIKTEGRDKKLSFRGGGVEYWIDEVPYTGSTGANLANSINLSDVAYIKLLKNSIRGLGGGSGALLIYTKKGNEKEFDKRFNQQVAIEGINIFQFQ